MIDTVSTEIAEGEERIRLHVADRIATLTLCRPDRLNGWSWESSRQLGLLADRIRFDPEARVVVLRAEGRAFCAGIDVTAPGRLVPPREGTAARIEAYREGIRWVHERFAVLSGLPQPVIAAVQGPCIGFGFELALLADIRVAADDAVFALPEVGLGVAVDAGGDLRIAREAGAGWAKMLALTGRRIDAERAARLNLVQEVVPRADLDKTVTALAAEIAAKAPLAVRAVKRAVDSYADAALPAALDRVAASAALTLASEDCREGYAARAERREAEFEGH
ncbi:enoyl-CoA hydratase/isomerase family protein [Streptomyces sp. BI20]|uniref:enoyl-CoA hydratase/isomerase family protein n=1 Tax=Streptomyces sp. BI20 TaxID=3403460 RepID=UPI003C797101